MSFWRGKLLRLSALSVLTGLTFATGELRGDGMTVPYYWVWVPAQLYIAPPPPPVAG